MSRVVLAGNLQQGIIYVGQRLLPNPRRSEPQAGEHRGVVDTIRISLNGAIGSFGVELVKLGALNSMVKQPVLRDPGLLVLKELLATIAPRALWRDDLHHQIGGTREKGLPERGPCSRE